MKRIMKVAALTACVGAMLGFVGCNSNGSGKPEDVVLEVLKKIQEGSADSAFLNKYCDEDTAKLFSGFGSEMTSALKGATFTVANVFVDDDVAVVKIKQEGGKEPGEFYYDAQIIDSQWKIKINKEAHGDYYCISQKTIIECVEAFKAAASKEGDVKYKERCTKEFWDEMQGIVTKGSPDELREIQKALSELKIKGHKKSVLHDGAIEVNLEMPGKEDGSVTHNDLILKITDGKWKACKID